MDFGIKDKVALVTAASKGLGRGSAEELAREGARVAICARHGDEAERTAQEIAGATGSEVAAFQTDVSRAEALDELVAGVRSRLGDPDILVTNAGGPPPGTFASTGLEQFDQAYQLTLMSAVRLIHQCVPAMQQRKWGRVVVISSICVKQPFGNLLLSNVFRTGLTGFVKTLAREVAGDNVTVNQVLSGINMTDRVTQVAQQRVEAEGITLEQAIADMTKPIPMGRAGQPDEFGALVAFLASARAAYLTGTSTQVDGGFHAGLM